MFAIFKKELRSYFVNPIGYVFVGIFLLFSALACCYTTLLSQSYDTSVYFMIMMFAFVILIPLLTMRLFSEERKMRTEQLLLTAPVTLTGMVMGKFLASYSMFGIAFLISCLNLPVALSHLSEANLFRYNAVCALGGAVALFLVGGTFIAIGVFISALTENQIVSGSVTIVVLATLLLISFVNSYIGFAPLRAVFSWLSIYTRFSNFSAGYFDIAALLYYLSIMGVCIFLTVRVYEKRRWA